MSPATARLLAAAIIWVLGQFGLTNVLTVEQIAANLPGIIAGALALYALIHPFLERRRRAAK